MSAKNRRDAKKIRTLERALRKGRLPRYLDLIEWLEDHGHADTKKAALKLILEDRVIADSHPLGKRILSIPGPTKQFPNRKAEKKQVLDTWVPASLRPSIHVIQPKED